MNTITEKNIFSHAALRARIMENYPSIEHFASVIHMKPGTLNSRLDGKTEFSIGEMRKICTALDAWTNEDINRLFFTTEDAEMKYRAKAIVTLANDLNHDEIKLLFEIMDLVIGRPDRRDFALSWAGKMKDLPAALAQI